ncbi:MSC_0624 family F1-like ATPase-associated membrane protein, partial [Mycoplasmopsis bovis]|uniref:MSC_0624 family F1-like ATPase-associated membrane protein n=1 Tax=Mycoplasmopsis bovis TaxID=28903 RepID=UPI003D2C8CD4
AYLNINKNKEHIRIYGIWFSIYWALSIAGFLLFFTYHTIEVKKLVYVLFALVIFLLTDISYALFNFNTKNKTEPVIYQSKILEIKSITNGILLWYITGS